jgi:rubrerythrin
MKILRVLEKLEEFEARISLLYKRLSELFDKDPEASSLFSRLSVEEEMHASIVRYQRRLVVQNTKMFEHVEFEAVELDELTKAIEKLDSFERAVPSLEEALRFALELEGDATECHYKAALAGMKPELLPFFKSLASFDSMHLHEFERFAHSRGFSVPPHKEGLLADADALDAGVNEEAAAREAGAEGQPSVGQPGSVPQAVIERIDYYYTWHKNLGYYRVLDLREHATDPEVKEAYYAMVKEFHPDRFVGLPDDLLRKVHAVFIYISEAYRTLSDPRLRIEYDRSLRKLRK